MYNRIAKILYFIILCLLCVSNLGAQETVLCDTTRSVYYVKKNGKGDGSSWRNAMSGDMFAYVLPRVKANTTFHIAAGVYKPIYNINGEKTDITTDRVFYTEKPVKLIGGYSNNTRYEGELPDPYSYFTIFSGDHENNDSNDYSDHEKRSDNSMKVLWINQKEAGDSEVYGIDFTGGNDDAEKYLDNILCSVTSPGDLNLRNNVTIHECYFESSACALCSNVTNTYISDCYFDNLRRIFMSFKSNLKLTACSFSDVNNVSFYSDKGKTATCTNSVFYNVSAIDLDSEELDNVLEFYHNTVINCPDFDLFATHRNVISLIGNIFINTDYFFLDKVKTEYNAFCPISYKNYSQGVSDTDKKIENFTSILNYNSVIGEYVLDYDYGGFAEMVNVVDEEAKDDILVPRSATQVLYDQRWKERGTQTCAGAYEYGCDVDTYIVRSIDIIQYQEKGKKTNDHMFEKVGFFYYDTLVDLDNCKRITRYPVLVTPVLSLSEYYVREKAKGKGTGTSWNDAMDADMFAYVLANFTSDSCTFHLAEGVYKPVYNEANNIDDNFSSRTFLVSKPIKIIGGYSNANQPVYNPKLYSTIFSGDILSNDDEDESASFKDNVTSLWNIKLDISGTTLFKGVSFAGAQNEENTDYHLFNYESTEENSLTFEQCRFTQGGCALQVHNANMEIKNSVFDHLNVPFTYCYPIVNVSSSSFYETDKLSLLSSEDAKEWNFTNCTFMIDNMISVEAKENTDCSFRNSTIFCDDFLIDVDESSQLDLMGNIFGKQVHSKNTVPSSSFHSEYNVHLLPLERSVSNLLSQTDLFVAKSEYKNFISEELQYVGNSFTPILPLICDSTSEGESLRYKQGANPLLRDQIGTSRPKYTCRGAHEYTASKKEIPTLFTPYSVNGKNDVFMKGCEVYIYDLYGMLICHHKDGWNGYDNNNKQVAPGIYIYVVDIPKEGIRKGTIEVFK